VKIQQNRLRVMWMEVSSDHAFLLIENL